jgi:hypothetical protein
MGQAADFPDLDVLIFFFGFRGIINTAIVPLPSPYRAVSCPVRIIIPHSSPIV